VLPAGLIVTGGGFAALGALARGARGRAAVLLASTLIAAHWVLVLWALPDFERYKPVPRLAATIEAQPARPSAVGTYRIAAPSLVFYLRRHVVEMFAEEELVTFLAGHPGGVCVMPAEAYEAVRAKLPMSTRVLAGAERFDARLSTFLSRDPLPQLLLVAAAPGSAAR
jgi:hypothetical protein